MLDVTAFFHAPTGTWSYVAADPATGRAAVVDPVRDYDAASGRTGTVAADGIVDHIVSHGLTVDWILETHAHADHVSAATYVRGRLGGTLGIGAGIREVQRQFRDLFDLGADFPVDGSQFDRLFADDDDFRVGGIDARVIATPGHTADGVSYVIGDAVFVGDTLFLPDSGTARCDFPGGSAERLYASIQRLYGLPSVTRMFVCHDYGVGGREVGCETTVAAQRAANIHVRDGVTRDEFVARRNARDATLAVPELLIPALQVNLRGGEFPPPAANGTRYLKIPVDAL